VCCRGHRLVLSSYPAQQNVAQTSVTGYKDRMVRWVQQADKSRVDTMLEMTFSLLISPIYCIVTYVNRQYG